MVQLLELIDAGKVVSPEACKEMLGHLKACDDKEKMTRFLPAGTVVAHKTGSVNASKTDAGIIYLKSGPVALCVLTDENDDKRWVIDNAAQVLIAKIAKEVCDHFGGPRRRRRRKSSRRSTQKDADQDRRHSLSGSSNEPRQRRRFQAR